MKTLILKTEDEMLYFTGPEENVYELLRTITSAGGYIVRTVETVGFSRMEMWTWWEGRRGIAVAHTAYVVDGHYYD